MGKNSDFCNVANVTFSDVSVSALRELEEISKFGNAIAVIHAAATFKQIFVDRRYVKVVESIATTDWEEFATAMINVNAMTRDAARLVTHKAYYATRGKEQAFWRCMTNALR